jgi:hypothetical protein
MNTLSRNKVPGKRGIKNMKIQIAFLLVLLLFSRCKNRYTEPGTQSLVQETGYLMIDGSGYYSLQMNDIDISFFKEHLKRVKEVHGFQFDINIDSIAQLHLHYDTLVDLNKQEKGFPPPYIFKRITPIKIVYSADSATQSYLKDNVSLPIRFDKGEFTFIYKAGGVKVIKIMPLKEENGKN